MKHQATNTGLLRDPDGQWVKTMTSHVLGARWLSHWPHTDLCEQSLAIREQASGRRGGQLGCYKRSQLSL